MDNKTKTLILKNIQQIDDVNIYNLLKDLISANEKNIKVAEIHIKIKNGTIVAKDSKVRVPYL